MSMLNYLYANRLTAFSAADKAGVNADGGVGLWTLPPSTHYAFNPQKVLHSRWMFLIAGSYEPTDRRSPIEITYSGNKVRVSEASSQTMYFTVLVREVIGDEILVSYKMVSFTAGSTQKTVSGTNLTVQGVVGVSFIAMQTNTSIAVIDNRGQLYYCSDNAVAVYEDENYLIYQGNILYKATTLNAKVLLSILNQSGGGYTENFMMDLYRGECSFDVSAVVRNWFTTELAEWQTFTDLDTSATAQFVVDKRLMIDFSVQLPYTLDDSATDLFSFHTINGCKQISEPAVFFSGNLNKLPLRKYYGYPVERTIYRTTGNIPPTMNIPLYPSGSVRVATNTITRAECSSSIADYSCIPQAPFYLRWISDNGAVEQWMFERKQTYKPAVKSSSTYEKDIENVQDAMTNEIAYDITMQNQIVIGAEDVEQSIYEVLKKLPFSPEIEWYREDTGKWIRLVVDKFDSSYDTDSHTHELEITLSLPTRYVQF